MTRRIEWLPQAIVDLKDVPDWRVAADISAAVKLFALTGVGTVVAFQT